MWFFAKLRINILRTVTFIPTTMTGKCDTSHSLALSYEERWDEHLRRCVNCCIVHISIFFAGILASLHYICALCSSLSETPSGLSWFVYSCVKHSWGCFSKARNPTRHVRSCKLMCMLSFPILLQTASELPCCIFYHLLSVLLACPLIINMCMLW
jgi:hypothetical protein